MTTLEQLNGSAARDVPAFVNTLHGIYEHSPWIPERAAKLGPFANITALKQALQGVVTGAERAEQLGLIRAHPELAGKAAIAGELTAESTGEQAKAGLNLCTPEEFATLQKLNGDYNAKFGFPFILAVKGATGKGLTRQQIITTFTRRLRNQPEDELREALRQIGRIAEMRINDLLGYTPAIGATIMEWAEEIGSWSEDEGALTCTFMTDAHRRTADQIAHWMREAGMHAHIDAVGNVVGRYLSTDPQAKTLMTGSHYDTVRNGGKYDGREGILLPIAIVKHLHEKGETLPFHFEIIGFSEEEGVRFKSTFLGSNAIIGQFDLNLLNLTDRDGVSMRDVLTQAGHDVTAIPKIARDPSDLLGYVEVHIEQGPVLLNRDLPVGIVTSIAGSSRYLVNLKGVASHAGTTPMSMRKDAAAAAAEIILYVEQRCGQDQHASLVGTVGQLQVPNGSTNVIPGACVLSLDIRAAADDIRDAAVEDVLKKIEEISQRRSVDVTIEKTVSAPAAPCAHWLMNQLAAATERAGVKPFELASGAGHDAMTIAKMTDVAMLFTRCGNGGISHNPLETMTADDAEVSAQILLDFLRNFKAKV
ncbi:MULTISPECIES: allantoate amidohydrolase [unclassified Herbaspirillum]|uniref:allantoate amidohydrolase n=1 Tax=unclassified Herbaspirillum TaxID=2624150 RepID=UPI000E2FCCDC|nr:MULTISPECIES: allantoate amidohydrolase [unclassified Herbaspirillum]RFB73951.1 allantoate amidohydrolase [Herbaspirillum sp. 3R-3a1]TFI10238.1 allantoate amidohydrolase [Herbaspirillum sp. 3R11]TFI16142.1 allantoate amidohydrolase [Herbaspirillum sp. 3R-11]TFI24452.1 allantoate amidohydrolase [Herbaspirillum sp. 3C11]